MRLPVFTSLAGYRGEWLRGDLIAGLSVWAAEVVVDVSDDACIDRKAPHPAAALAFDRRGWPARDRSR